MVKARDITDKFKEFTEKSGLSNSLDDYTTRTATLALTTTSTLAKDASTYAFTMIPITGAAVYIAFYAIGKYVFGK